MNARARARIRRAVCCLLLLFARPSFAEDGSFVRDGVTLHYRTEGSGTPVVFLSGGPGFDVDYMIPVAEFLPASYQRVFFDQRGTGRSVIPDMTADHMTLEHAVEDLEGLRIILERDRLILLGHSWGGMLAMAYAARHPDRVDRLVLAASGGPTLEFITTFGDNLRARLRPEDVEAERYWQEAEKRGVDSGKAGLEALKAIVPGYFFDRSKALAFAAQLREGTLHPQVNTLLFQDLAKSYDVREGVRRLDRPVLIVHGHQDPISDRIAADIHALIPSSTLQFIHRAGHFPWIEQPEEFGRILAAFFAARQ
jgi:proline iminopeptidase